MAQNDIFEVSFVVAVNGQQTATVLHAEQTTVSPTTDEAQDLINAITASTIPTNWAARSSNDAILDCIKAQRIKPTRGIAVIEIVGTAGTVSSDALPSTIGAQHFWQSPPFGRRNKGWHNWSGIPDSAHNRGRLIQAALLLEGTFGESFENPITSVGDYQFGVYSDLNGTIEALGQVLPRIVLKQIRNRKPELCV